MAFASGSTSRPTDNFNSRLLHLDLKGAPLTIPYLERVLPMLKEWGSTGLLVEYEDMFPYVGDLAQIAAPHAYCKDDIERLQKIATELDFMFIPLVQTFGHFEFVLKHSQYSSLREVEKYPMALCPSNPDSLKLVYSILDQVILLHPNIRYFHLGCDEVFHLGMCKNCKSRLDENLQGKEKLFFDHVKNIATYVKDKYPHLTCIVWDDMFRQSESSVVKDCGLGELVEPMIWHYQPYFQLPANLWDSLSVVFPNIWVASAFKGATGPSALVTNIHFHLDNHKAWLETLRAVESKFKTIRGIVLTGWQRYDHYAVLCELFPQGLPSLAVCLKFLQRGSMTPEDVNEIARDLKFSSPLPFDPMTCAWLPACEFPGRSVYQLSIEVSHLHRACAEFLNSDGVAGWLNDYNVKRGFANPVHVEPIHAKAFCLVNSCKSIEQRLPSAFEDVFVPGVLEEWKACFLEPILDKLEQFVTKTRALLDEGLT